MSSRELLKSLNERPIAYYPVYKEITGSIHSAILLSQLMYWFSKKDRFWKTNQEMQDEIGFTEREMKTAKNHLKNAGFITMTREGIPAKTWYAIDWDKAAHAISMNTRNDDTVQTSYDDTVPTVPYDTVPSITKTTTETTTDIGGAPAKQIPEMTRKAIQYLEEKAQRQFSADHKWLEYFRNDINKLYASLKGDDRAERILKVLEWYSTSDSPTVIISGRDLDEKFNKLESQMNFKPFDEQKPKPKFVHPPETIHDANPPHTRPGIGERNGEQ